MLLSPGSTSPRRAGQLSIPSISLPVTYYCYSLRARRQERSGTDVTARDRKIRHRERAGASDACAFLDNHRIHRLLLLLLLLASVVGEYDG